MKLFYLYLTLTVSLASATQRPLLSVQENKPAISPMELFADEYHNKQHNGFMLGLACGMSCGVTSSFLLPDDCLNACRCLVAWAAFSTFVQAPLDEGTVEKLLHDAQDEGKIEGFGCGFIAGSFAKNLQLRETLFPTRPVQGNDNQEQNEQNEQNEYGAV